MRSALPAPVSALIALVLVVGASIASAQDASPSPTEAAAPSPASAVPANASAPILSVAVLPIVSEGVDPIVPRRVVESVSAVVRSLGYDLVDDVALARAMDAVHASAPPSSAEIWRVTVLAGAQRGVAIRIGVRDSLYVAEVFVASADGAGPFRVQVVGDGSNFLANLAEAVRTLLPSPETFDAEAARRFSMGFAAAPPPQAGPGWTTATYAPRQPPRPQTPQPRYGITLVTESALGRYQGSRFYNHILGARMDFQLGQNVVIGLLTGYVNLDLGERRGSNLVFFAQLEDRLQFMATGRVRFPLKVAFGYVPFNGPFLRFSGGIRFPIGGRFELGLDLLAPTFWWVPDDRRVTYDFAAELTYRFGRAR